MQKETARTITTLSLLVALSVGANTVSAFPSGCGRGCQPVQYAAPARVQTTRATPVHAPTPTPELTEAQPLSSDGFIAIFWVRLLTIFASIT